MRRGAIAALALAVLGAAAGSSLSFVDLDGRTVELTAPSGPEVLVVHFWATWCPDCVKELAGLSRATRACEGTPVRVLAVDVGEEAVQVREFLAAHPVDLTILRDAHGEVWRRSVGGTGLPANLVWTNAGERIAIGPRAPADWQRELARLGCAERTPM